MDTNNYEIEPGTLFSESLIWQLNRDYYNEAGIKAWNTDIVPHHISSNSSVAKTYAEMILALLKDLALQKKSKHVVYILELGSGHGRFGFHILKHLDRLVSAQNEILPPFCYVLSDIVEENLSFFSDHPKLQDYYQRGILDLSFFDANDSKELLLRKSNKKISIGDLEQPVLAIANYFFDSLPNELFFIQDDALSRCSVGITSKRDPLGMSPLELIENMVLTYYKTDVFSPVYEDDAFNRILDAYRHFGKPTYILFPKMAIECLSNIKDLSQGGLILLTMDKGYNKMDDLEGHSEPDMVKHGSFSLWVNFHALEQYCRQTGGTVMCPEYSNFSVHVDCLLFTPEKTDYAQLGHAFNRHVNNFGPDDFNSIKQLAYFNVSRLKIKELIAFYRLSAYDSTIFIQLLPRLKELSKSITVKERVRLAQTFDLIWEMYFNINESFDLSYELGGLLYDLAYYEKALNYFQYSVDVFGLTADVRFNQALCYYQLREDQLFYNTLNDAKESFPNTDIFERLEGLDMA